MPTFIRAVEVWVPDDEGHLLERAGAFYGTATSFERASRGLCFGRGEGLPGQAWDLARPVLLPRFEGTVFRRTTAAHDAGLHSAIALPVFLGARLTSVVLLFCGTLTSDGRATEGAIELWHNDPRVTGDLRLDGALVGAGAAEVRAEAQDSSLPRGTGLPGLAWQREASVFVDRLEASPHFLRAQTAAAAGLVRGLAVPCSTPQQDTWVLNLLSSPRTPVARRVESWLPDASGTRFQRAFGHCELTGTLPAGAPIEAMRAVASALEGPVGRTFTDGRARVASQLFSRPDACTASAAAAGLGTVLTLPVIAGDTVGEVLALYF